MRITVNDTPREIPEGWMLNQLLGLLAPEGTTGMAAAINGRVIPRNEWNSQALSEGDEILLIKATQGG